MIPVIPIDDKSSGSFVDVLLAIQDFLTKALMTIGSLLKDIIPIWGN